MRDIERDAADYLAAGIAAIIGGNRSDTVTDHGDVE
jgi:hypothetical protein